MKTHWLSLVWGADFFSCQIFYPLSTCMGDDAFGSAHLYCCIPEPAGFEITCYSPGQVKMVGDKSICNPLVRGTSTIKHVITLLNKSGQA